MGKLYDILILTGLSFILADCFGYKYGSFEFGTIVAIFWGLGLTKFLIKFLNECPKIKDAYDEDLKNSVNKTLDVGDEDYGKHTRKTPESH